MACQSHLAYHTQIPTETTIKNSMKNTASRTVKWSTQSSGYMDATADQLPSMHLLAGSSPPRQYQFSGQMVGRLLRGEQNQPGGALQGVIMILSVLMSGCFYKAACRGF